MAFYQQTVVNKHLKTVDKQKLNFAYTKFIAYFKNPIIQENIRNSKEEQFQSGFLNSLFVDVLGYTLNPNPDFNLSTEYKNIKDSKKADGAILIDGQVKAVIELKGTETTDLSKVENQAFGYKNNQPNCTYVIISNFEKLRFYIDNAIEHIEFNLFTLQESDFELLYLCLAYENIEKNIPKKIKDESFSQEDTITKKLYNDYSLFKRSLHQNLVELNPSYNAIELFKKSQKLLDRFLFLFFAEDRQLLPPNSVRLILNQWTQLKELDETVPLYDRFKKYFGYLNTGFKGKQYDVFAYNGGLFKPDEILDSVKINDELLYEHTLKLSDYDFDSEVDVNILGHIFENSLNELDEIKAQLEGIQIDKAKTKRKKDGVFYTPKYITKYIVENTVGKLCVEKKEELALLEDDYSSDKKRQKKSIQLLDAKLTEYRKWLLNLKICDPACGSGAFLNQALDFLINEHRYLDELKAKLFGDAMVLTDMENSILENNLFGVDINEESVEIAKLSLWLRTAQPNRKLNDLSNNIKCGNSLIDDPKVAGEKAFNWFEEFPSVFEKKKKKVYHVTTATYNSRYSTKIHAIQPNYSAAVWLTLEEEISITNTISDIAQKDGLNIMAYNICGDHVHLLLACEEDELKPIVQKLKSMSSRACNIQMGRTIPAAGLANNEPLSHQLADQASDLSHQHAGGIANNEPLSHQHAGGITCNELLSHQHAGGITDDTAADNSSTAEERAETQNRLWGKSFGWREVTSHEQLLNTLAYIQNNRNKHQLLQHPKALLETINKMCCSYQQATKSEYNGGFNVVIGNPPYVNIANIQSILEREFLQLNYSTVKNKSDLYSIFTEFGYSILKSNSLLSFIFSNSWLGTESFTNFRSFLLSKTEIYDLVKLPAGVFQDAIVTTIILSFRKKTVINNDIIIKEFIDDKFIRFPYTLSYKRIKSLSSLTFSFDPELIIKIQVINLKEIAKFSLGIKTSDDNKFILKNKIDDSCYPMLRGRQISRYYYQKPSEWIWYKPELMMLKVGAGPRNLNLFKNEKIFIQDIAQNIIAFYCDEFILANDTLSFIYELDDNYSFKFILALLNSKLINTWFSFNFQAGLHIKINQLQQIPIPIIDLKDQQPFIEKADLMLSLNKQLQELSQKFQRSVERELFRDGGACSIGASPLLLNFANFLKQLEKNKLKLTLSQKAEWEDFFLQESKKALEIKHQIDATDKEIDRMVYELYELTEEEIAIVEGA